MVQLYTAVSLILIVRCYRLIPSNSFQTIVVVTSPDTSRDVQE